MEQKCNEDGFVQFKVREIMTRTRMVEFEIEHYAVFEVLSTGHTL